MRAASVEALPGPGARMENSSGRQNDTDRMALPPARSKRGVAVHDLHDLSSVNQEETMPRGDKSKYTQKQKRQAEHIEEGYEERGVPEEEAGRRAWATVNAMTGGGKKSGSGRGKGVNKAPAKKGGKKGGAASAARTAAERSASAKKAAQTRARRRKAGAYA